MAGVAALLGRLEEEDETFDFADAFLNNAITVEQLARAMYEQRKKDINKAQSDTLLNLARALGCGMEDIME